MNRVNRWIVRYLINRVTRTRFVCVWIDESFNIQFEIWKIKWHIVWGFIHRAVPLCSAVFFCRVRVLCSAVLFRRAVPPCFSVVFRHAVPSCSAMFSVVFRGRHAVPSCCVLLFRRVPPYCSVVFRHVPSCSAMLFRHVPPCFWRDRPCCFFAQIVVCPTFLAPSHSATPLTSILPSSATLWIHQEGGSIPHYMLSAPQGHSWPGHRRRVMRFGRPQHNWAKPKPIYGIL